MKAFLPILLLIFSNMLMTLAWYAHLKFAKLPAFSGASLFTVILISWGIAFFEYCLAVPANRLGYTGTGGAYNIWELKVIQEVISLSVFAIFAILVFKSESFRINHLIAFVFLVLAVYFMFKK